MQSVNKKRWKYALGGVLLLLALGWAWFGWQRPKDEIAYLTDIVSRADVAQTVNATGEIAPAQLVNVGAQVSGQIKKLHVKLGQTVRKGDLIAEIDSTNQTNALNTHKAKLESYRAQLVSARLRLQTAQRQYARERALWAEQANAQQDVENAADAAAAARASVGELQSAIRQTQIAINTAQADLGHTHIVSPMDGTVVSVPVEEGQTVNANQSAPTIVQVADLRQMLNKMQIAEGDVTKVRAGLSLSFTILSDPDTRRKAVLDTLDPGLTTLSQGQYTTSTDTGNSAVYYYARALVPNDDGSLHIGMTTHNSIVVQEAKGVLTTAAMAVKSRQDGRYVRVLKDGKQVEERAVTVGVSDGTRIEVVSGLQEGEAVIVSEGSGEVKEWQGNGPPRM